jgi:hypothetical protein
LGRSWDQCYEFKNILPPKIWQKWIKKNAKILLGYIVREHSQFF